MAPYWFDITGYLFVQQATDPATGEIKDVRNLLVGNHPNYEAKSRVPGLPTVIAEPDVSRMLDEIFGPSEELPREPAPVAQLFEAAPEPVPVPAGMPEKPSI
jgi:hypothetical protein